jgi:DNA polymerase elongation subunit (family B)
MEFKLAKVDPYVCSIEELETEIERLNNLKNEYEGIQNAIKVFCNSIYGACASPWFECYNVNVAEAVTLQGQDVRKFASSVIDDYFMNYWHKDKKLHEDLHITYANKINEKTCTIYADTDSAFLTFEPALKSCDYSGDPVEFILLIKKLRLNSYLKQKFEEYAKKYNTKNIQDLELEKIAYSAIMIAKKKYILDLAWKEPDIYFKPQEKIKHVGIEIVQGSTPKFARKVLKELVRMVCEKKTELQYAEVVKKLKEYKKEFLVQNPNDIAITKSIGDYEKYVLEDKKELRLAEKCPINVRAAGIYNYNLRNSKWKTKYNLIKTSDKIKYYYAKSEENVFGFLPNMYPYEFAPEINYDMQFAKSIIDPFSRIIETLGFQKIPESLIYSRSLF